MDTQETYTLKNGMTLTDPNDIKIFEMLLEFTPHCNVNFLWNDIGLGNLFGACFQHIERFCVDNQKWYIYNNGVWEIDKGDIKSQGNMQKLLQLLHLYCKEIENDTNKDVLKQYSAYINKSSSDTILRRCLNASKNSLMINITDFDNNPYLLNCTNGLYDLRTGSIVPNTHDLYITKRTTTYPAHALTTPCMRWYQFIDEIMSHDKDKAAFLQRALGYSLLGVNKEECMFMAYGALSRNGKGTLMSAVKKALSEDYADSSDIELICQDKSGRTKDFNSPQPAIARLVGKRLVEMSETNRDHLLASAPMKTMTGRDTLITRGLHENSFAFVPQFTMWLSTNYLPTINDDTVFKSNRIWVIEFNEHFDASRQDRDLKELFESPENLPTVLRWLMDGCADYIKNGLNPPESVRKATANYRERYDRIGNFIKEKCTVDMSKKTLRSTLNAAYRSWCSSPDNRFTPLSPSNFFNEIELRGFPVRRANDGFYVHGISLNEVISSDGKIIL